MNASLAFATLTTLLAISSSMAGRICVTEKQSNCVTFNVSPGTGCAWMCNYCAEQLGTTNYYFTDGVCKYETGGCAGNPQAGAEYTCCSA